MNEHPKNIIRDSYFLHERDSTARGQAIYAVARLSRRAWDARMESAATIGPPLTMAMASSA